MQIMFLKENEKIKMWKFLLKKVEINEDKIIINGNINNLEFNKKRKLVSLIKNKAKCKKVILTKSLKQDRDFVNLLYSNEIEIANSKYLFKLLIKDVIEKICSSNKINTKTSEISFLINYKDKKILDVIEQIAQEFKSVHIVTNNIESFVKFSKKEYEENGIIITLTNNKQISIYGLIPIVMIYNYSKSISWVIFYCINFTFCSSCYNRCFISFYIYSIMCYPFLKSI